MTIMPKTEGTKDCDCGYAQGKAHFHSPECAIYFRTPIIPTEGEEISIVAGNIWREIHSVLEKHKVKLPPNFDGIDTAYGCYTKIGLEIQSLLSSKAKEICEKLNTTFTEMLNKGEPDRFDAEAAQSIVKEVMGGRE
jgi:hypothetical protein